MRRGSIRLVSGLLLVGFLGVLRAEAPQVPAGASKSTVAPARNIRGNGGAQAVTFMVRSYQGRSRCLDYTPEKNGSPVFLNDCKLAHPVGAQEINNRHEVILHAGNLVIGIHNPLVIHNPMVKTSGGAPPPPPTEYTLELQGEANPLTPLAANQIFALDGDSIILVANRSFVFQVLNARGAIGTPVVMGPRTLADNGFWDFVATDELGGGPRGQVAHFSPLPTDARFFFVSNLGKCLDVKTAAGDENAPIVVSGCTQASSQRIEIKEVGPARQVNLKAAGKCLAPGLNSIIQQMPLALRACDGSDLQKFVLDGDSIIAATNRDLVVEVRNGAGADRTQLWFGQRDLDGPEFWKLVPEDGTSVPTSGFVRVPEDVPDLATALASATAGSVIQLNTNVTASAKQHLAINEGVTLRGGRHDIDPGPEVFAPTEDNDGLFVMQGEFTRITGLRVRGPSRNTENVDQAVGIFAKDEFHAIIDHNDVSDWPHAAIEVRAGWDADCIDQVVSTGNGPTYVAEPWDSCCARNRDHRTPTSRVRVARNFIHHNRLQGRGYGVVAYGGAYPRIEGNTFTQNRHAIASDGKPFTGYQAVFNLVLSLVPLQEHVDGLIEWHTQDFDVHGRFHHGNYFGSAAGNHTEILSNTFLGTSNENKYPFGEYFFTDHPNFHLRGTPCDFVLFTGNISLESQGDSINYDGEQKDLKLQIADNSFSYANPTASLGVGDFDGDGYDDVFLATGNAWYFAPRGKAEWRFLRADSTTVESLMFGDFDGDGRTDVFTQRGSDWLVSWGGLSNWEKIGSHPEPMSEYRIGQFDDDRRSDIFFASGTEWLVSSGGTGPFVRLALASERSAQVRLGDFNGDGKTDVLVPTDTGWTIFQTGTGRVERVHRHDATRHPVAVVADFDGDGRADVASGEIVHIPKEPNVVRWVFVTHGGVGPWVRIATRKISIASALGMGRFADRRRVDVLEWSGTHLSIISAVPNQSGTLSWQDMR